MTKIIQNGVVVCIILMMITVGLSGFITNNSECPGVSKETIKNSIDKGVAWLVKKQHNDGSWGPTSYKIACTGFVLIKLQEYAYEIGKSPFDEDYQYKDNVTNGWKFLFKTDASNNSIYLMKQKIGPQKHGTKLDDPDTNQNGYGLRFGSGSSYISYNTGICLMALTASGTPERKNDGELDFNGDNITDTFFEIAQDTVDWIAFAQGDEYYSLGGWSYSYLDNSSNSSTDNSNSGYVVLGLAAAEIFGCTVSSWVKEKLSIWVDNIQDPVDSDANGYDGGSYYSPGGNSANSLRTGNLIFEMAFCGDTQYRKRFRDALDFLERHWYSESLDPGWGYSLSISEYQAMFCIMKGFEYSNIDYIDLADLGEPEHNWYYEFAEILTDQQHKNGYWPQSLRSDDSFILSTCWALLTLEKIAPAEYVSKPPKANVGELYVGYEGSPITFNATLSTDPNGDDLKFRWDFNNDGVWDTGWSENPIIKYNYGDDWLGKIILEVREKNTTEAFTAKDSAIVIVNNIAPKIKTSPNMTIMKNETLELFAMVSDPGSDDLSVEWLWGSEYANASKNYTMYLNNEFMPDPYPSFQFHPRLINDTVSCKFNKSGQFKVVVVVKDDDDGSDFRNITIMVNELVNETKIKNETNITIIEPPNKPPIAKLKANPMTGIAPLKVYFTGSGIDEDGTIVAFQWEFSDGLAYKYDFLNPTNITYNVTARTFDKPGVYFIELNVTDDDGANGYDTISITVESKPQKVNESYHITGYVFEEKTSICISGANVSIGEFWIITDQMGNYYMKVDLGEYYIAIGKNGYEPTTTTIIVTSNVTRDFYLRPIETPEKEIDFSRNFSWVWIWIVILIVVTFSIIISSLIAQAKMRPKYDDYYDEPIRPRPRPAPMAVRPKPKKPQVGKEPVKKPAPLDAPVSSKTKLVSDQKQVQTTSKTKTPTLAETKTPKPVLTKTEEPTEPVTTKESNTSKPTTPPLDKPATPEPTVDQDQDSALETDQNIPASDESPKSKLDNESSPTGPEEDIQE